MVPARQRPAERREQGRKETSVLQAAATDPTASSWVSANAGTGKTFVLVRRVLRLLLAGTAPERILCLTFTKAAAAEMQNRLLQRLSEWVTFEAPRLQETLAEILTRPATQSEMHLARILFARAIETPGGLKVQTIHAFCERLLQRFPLEAEVPPNFTILDEAAQTQLLARCIDDVLAGAITARAGDLRDALNIAVAHAGDQDFDEVLRNAVSKRDHLEAALLGDLRRGKVDRQNHVARALRALGYDVARSEEQICRHMANLLTPDQIKMLVPVLREGKKTDDTLADRLLGVMKAAPAQRIDLLREAFLTKLSEPRKQLMTKAVGEANPAIADLLRRAQVQFQELDEELLATKTAEASAAMTVIAEAVLQRYADAKARQGALDYDDLIVRTSQMLNQSSDAHWVLYKLDGGLDHIVVDEAQDTSPRAWEIIARLGEEFFSGEGARESTRTIFAVGDEKQSIYGFQGAAPEMFRKMGREFETRLAEHRKTWRRVPLHLSFRTVEPILDSVDAVFADPGITTGVEGAEGAIHHAADRIGQAGLVEIWPTLVPQEEDKSDPWNPAEPERQLAPSLMLAERIASTISSWLNEKAILESKGRAIRPGDILILVRKRAPFAPMMIKALKRRGIPVAGADRIKTAEQLAVKDLLALCEFILLPEDDLSLAVVLKSPIVGLTEEQLFELAYERQGHLWNCLLRFREADNDFGRAARQLMRLRARADYMPAFEFLATLLDTENYRERLLGRLGPEAGDALDDLLGLALSYDRDAPISLQGFVHWLRRSNPEIRRDMDQGRDEVRVMTVHGAKGLEADIVFIADTCTIAGKTRTHELLVLEDIDDDGKQAVKRTNLIWPIRGAGRLAQIRAARDDLLKREREEYHRLLYVAMTRARDRLYVCGFETRKGREKGCWYDLVFNALSTNMEAVSCPQLGMTVHRKLAKQTVPVCGSEQGVPRPRAAHGLPAWMTGKAATEHRPTIPITPSRLEAVPADCVFDGQVPRDWLIHEGMSPAAPSPLEVGEGAGLLRGQLTHMLLQYLPDLARDHRDEVARALMESRGAGLDTQQRERIVREATRLVDHDALAPAFGPGSLAEVPIVAEIPDPSGQNAPLRISGRIDRLIVTEGRALIVDFKTDRAAPSAVGDVARTYLLQLAAYRLAVSQIYASSSAGIEVETALVWTLEPSVMTVPAEVLDEVEPLLWHDFAALDGQTVHT